MGPPQNVYTETLNSKVTVYEDRDFMEVKWKSLSRVRLFATSGTIQFMEFSGPEYWRGGLFPSPGNLWRHLRFHVAPGWGPYMVGLAVS